MAYIYMLLTKPNIIQINIVYLLIKLIVILLEGLCKLYTILWCLIPKVKSKKKLR